VPDVLAGDRGAYVTRTVDLSSCVGSGRLADASQLRSAKVTVQPKLRCVEFHAAGPEGGVEPICHPADPMTFDVDYAWLDADVEGVGEPSALSSQVDIAPADPAHRNSITFFGPVHLPYTDVEVQWRGGRWSMPVFAGGVVARGLASWSVDPGTVGVLASPDVDIGQTRVLLRARRSGSSGPLAGSAIVRVDAPLVGAGSRRVEDWALCSEEWATSTSGCR